MKSLRNLLLVPVLAVTLSSAGAQTIIDAGNFVSGGSSQPLNGTTIGLTTNLPGGSWVWGAGYNWAAPQVNPTWLGGSLQNAAWLAEENTVLSLALGSSGGYTKPVEFTVSSELIFRGVMANNVAGLGFWSTQPTQSNGASSLVNFTGFTFDETGSLRLYSGGAYTGISAALGALSEDVWYSLTYTVNTSTGAVSNILFEGSSISGFSSTSVFSDSATAYIGAAAGAASRVGFDDLTVSAVPEPGTSAMVLLGALGLVFHLRRCRKVS